MSFLRCGSSPRGLLWTIILGIIVFGVSEGKTLLAENSLMREGIQRLQLEDIFYRYPSMISLSKQAIISNNTLRRYASLRDAAKEEWTQALSKWLPQIELTSSLSSEKILGQTDDSYTGQVQLEQNILDFSLMETVRVRRAAYQKAEATYLKERNTLILQIAETFFRLLKQAELIRVYTEIASAFERIKDVVSAEVEEGRRLEVDLLDAVSKFREQEQRVIAAQLEMKKIKATLASYLSLDIASVIHVTDRLYPLKITISQDKARELARIFNPEIAESRFEVDRLKSVENETKRGLWPNLRASAEYGFHSQDRFEWDSETESWSAGIQLRFPFGDVPRWVETRANKARKQSARFELEQGLFSREEEAYHLVQDVAINQSALEAARIRVEYRQKAFQIKQDQYMAGKLNMTDLVTGQDDLLEAERDLLDAVYELNLTWMKLWKVTGGTMKEE